MHGVLRTPGAMGLFRQALKGFGLVGAVALEREGLEHGRYSRGRHVWLRLGEVHHDEEPDKCTQGQLVVKKRTIRLKARVVLPPQVVIMLW